MFKIKSGKPTKKNSEGFSDVPREKSFPNKKPQPIRPPVSYLSPVTRGRDPVLSQEAFSAPVVDLRFQSWTVMANKNIPQPSKVNQAQALLVFLKFLHIPEFGSVLGVFFWCCIETFWPNGIIFHRARFSLK